MNKIEKDIAKAQLSSEEKTLKELQQVFKKARKDVQDRITELNARQDMQNLQSIVYQKKYQQAILNQINEALADLSSGQYKTVEEYLVDSYDNGYIGMMYSLQSQGIPMTVPINDRNVVKALTTDSQLSKKYYKADPLKGRLEENVTLLKTRVRSNLSRGIIAGKSWLEVAVDIASGMNNPFDIALKDAMRIARTEGHRVHQQGYLDAGDKAKEKGADILKQWDATMDSKTRPAHQQADGQIVEWDEYFTVGGEKMKAPSVGGSAKNVVNCRCQLLQRARWALDEEELETLQKRAEFFGLDKAESFEDFKQRYLKLPEKADTIDLKPASTFTPAKTKAEAEEYAKRFADSVSYKGVSLENANIINQRLEELQAKYPINRLSEIKVGGSKGVMSANYKGLWINGKSLGKALEDSHKNFLLEQEEIKKSIKLMTDNFAGKKIPTPVQHSIDVLQKKLMYTRWGVSDLYPDKVAITVTHEYGHIIADQYFGQINGERANPSLSLNWSLNQVKKDWESVYMTACQNGDSFKVSKYGSTNSKEFFAECFAMRECGEELPDYIESMMKGILENGIL